MPTNFERLLLRLSYHIGEGELSESTEDRIIAIEERWHEEGKLRGEDLLWLQETLKKVEENQ
jgi:hypothetical protein